MPTTKVNQSLLLTLSIHHLSKILTYCSEVDGTCALITCRKLYKCSKIFQIPEEEDTLRVIDNNAKKNCNQNDPMYVKELTEEVSLQKRKEKTRRGCRLKNVYRHRYYEVSVTDPKILLERLNTRRSYIRKRQRIIHNIPLHLQKLQFKDDCFLSSNQKLGNANLPVLLVSYPRCGNSLLRSLIGEFLGQHWLLDVLY